MVAAPPRAACAAGGLLVLRATGRYLTLLEPSSGELLPALVRRRLSVVVGDRVDVEPRGDRLVAVRVHPRRTVLRRREGAGVQILAANVELLVIVTAVGPQFRPGLIDRMLVAADVDGIEPLIVLNKIDLDGRDPAVAGAERYRRLGYRLLATSAVTGEGLPALAAALAGRVSVLAGHSGVGKSSLLNALAPGADRAVAEVNPVTGKGRHTTSVAEGYPFAGGVLIDLPGLREFGLAGVAPHRLAGAFPELRAAAAGCRFADCLHEVEPDCAVRRAVERGEIAPQRYDSYLRMLASLRPSA
ncbi:MAG TPA: ribosome small subunit-dependent GTPase A [Thermodesulfobacteriota bacterium]|nr:ribosome small subunit-dependent GTPase A [Thermodesulfobacteriota bacterium]